MGRKGNCFVQVRKVFSHESKEKKRVVQKTNNPVLDKLFAASASETNNALNQTSPSHPLVPVEEVTLSDKVEEVHAMSEHVGHLKVDTVMETAGTSAPPAQESAEVIDQATTMARFPGKSREEAAAIILQTAFRGHLARRAIQSSKGMSRLRSLVQGEASKRQVVMTLHSMQKLAKVQSQIQSGRIRAAEENQNLQRQLQLKREQELEALKASMGEEWDDSLQSKEKINANVMSKYEANVRRERAMAYAFTHQRKTSLKAGYPMFTDLSNPQWDWSWIERWTGGRHQEGPNTLEKEVSYDDGAAKNVNLNTGGQITNAYARRDTSTGKPSTGKQRGSRPAMRHHTSTLPYKASPTTKTSKPEHHKDAFCPSDDDSRSPPNTMAEQNRRHSISGPTTGDDDSLGHSQATPNFMTPTKSAKAKSRFQSSLVDKVETPEKGAVGTAKKRMSLSSVDKHGACSPSRMRRHSGPPKINVSSVKVATSVD